MSTPFDDIINLPHYVSSKRKPMPMGARAPQFAPFAALPTHGIAIAETARTTISRHELSVYDQQVLSQKIRYAVSLAEHPQLSITYFQPDCRKAGGSYVCIRGSIKKVDEIFNRLILTDHTEIPLDTIRDISGEIFTEWEI